MIHRKAGEKMKRIIFKNFVVAIASQWIKNNVQTVSDAMDLAEKEHKKKYKKETNSSTIRKARVIPEWFNENISSEESTEASDLEFKNFIEEFRK